MEGHRNRVIGIVLILILIVEVVSLEPDEMLIRQMIFRIPFSSVFNDD
jgi:hypothetical protein